ncbi:MAG: methyltransferase domain-containing protein [Desulfobacter sp.]|nr:MAG: methyltransferase domain-containing protein [Desulfobacter sp.]
MTSDALDDTAENADWGVRWKAFERKSFLKQSQVESPEKWQQFYDKVSDLWEHMAGINLACAREMAAVLALHGLCQEQDAILEIGCGPGNLSIALAGQGGRVTAMDNSRGMIRLLEDKIQTRGISGIKPLVADWNSLDSTPEHDLIVAAFFPEACSPQGILRLEKLAKRACVLVLGNGVAAFPFYRQIWTKVMDIPLPASTNHLTCARNFLKQTGRSPQVYDLSLPAVLDIEFHRAREYFRSYFGMFGCSGPHMDKTIDDVLSPYVEKHHICLKGEFGAAMVCWHPPNGSPNHRSMK